MTRRQRTLRNFREVTTSWYMLIPIVVAAVWLPMAVALGGSFLPNAVCYVGGVGGGLLFFSWLEAGR